MKANKGKIIGLIVLVIVILGAIFYGTYNARKPSQIEINGLIGSEKQGLFDDQEFKNLVAKKYGLTYKYTKSGSFDQVNLSSEDLKKYDYLFPSNQLALEVFKNNNHKSTKNEIVLNTPIVLYTRKPVAEALINHGIVKSNNGIYEVDMTKLSELVLNSTKWADIGVPELYGDILIDSTNPNRSNSGNMFLGLLANSLNNGKVVDRSSLAEVKPKIKTIYDNLGYMQVNSGDLFEQFLKQGMGAFPIIAGYENQILEFSKENPEIFNKVKDDIVIMYPTPTVWSSHVFIALNENGSRALEGLVDSEVQDIAWKNHGFRTGVSGTTDIKDFDVNGLRDSIVTVMPMPSVDIMNELMAEIQ